MENKSTSPLKPDNITKAWEEINNNRPGIRIREAAAELNLSEAQLLATMVGKEAIRLKPEWKVLLHRLPELGRVMSLTRNNSCILEHKGVFEKVNIFGKENNQMATVVGPIETRVFLKSWHVAFAVKQQKGDRLLTSIQVFDHEGQAITKIYLQEDSNFAAYEKLVQDLRSNDQSQDQNITIYDKTEYAETINKKEFLRDWSVLKDTHGFFPLLKKYKANRLHALELANGTFTYPVAVSNIQKILETMAKKKLPLMIFSGNRGNLQIHQDKVRIIRLLNRGHSGKETWLNVLDPDFNMHLRMDLIKNAWVVTKPTKDGTVTSIECFDSQNELAVQFFGLRKPGQPEMDQWKKLVNSLDKSL